MLIACCRASLLISGVLISGVITAALSNQTEQPDGFWVLENKDLEKPCGGLKLNRPQTFSLVVFDSNCQRYQVEGKVRRREHSWELKSQVDHSSVFTLTRESNRLRLVDTEGLEMLFTPATEAELEQELNRARSQRCALSRL